MGLKMRVLDSSNAFPFLSFLFYLKCFAGEAMEDNLIASAHSSAFIESEDLEGQSSEIEGYDFNQGIDYPRLLSSMLNTGFQASNLGDAIQVVNQMVNFLSPSQLHCHLVFNQTHHFNCTEARLEPSRRGCS